MTMIRTFIFCLLVAGSSATAQLYFPPADGSSWETVSLDELGWCAEPLDSLVSYIARNDSKAFIVLKNGRIAVEWYADGFLPSDNWYWASAGKSVTSTLVGIAQQNGHLHLTDKSSDHLGVGWTSLTTEQEEKITVWHQLTMTTGLDDGAGDVDCTEPACLVYKAEPGSRWAYHNAPYTLLDDVIEGATDSSRNVYLSTHLNKAIGMDGAFIKLGYNQVLFSTPRSMARYGLLALNGFNWDGRQILDPSFAHDAVNTSQELNKSYGYLWWLNGKETFMMPSTQIVFPGQLTPNAPPDAFYALGKNDQIICVVPSEDLVFIRMGDPASPDGPPVANVFADEIWELLRAVMCDATSVSESGEQRAKSGEQRTESEGQKLTITRIGVNQYSVQGVGPFSVMDVTGRTVLVSPSTELSLEHLPAGIYFVVDNSNQAALTVSCN